MADSRFFQRAGPLSLSQIATVADAELPEGCDPERLIADVAPLDKAGPDDVSFLDNKRYTEAFEASRAGACIAEPALASRAPTGMVVLSTAKPYRAYARVAAHFYPEPAPIAFRHDTAVVDTSAKVDESCHLGAYVVVGANAELGAGCSIGAGTVIEDGVVIGAGSRIGSNVTLSHCMIGKGCHIHSGVRIGNRGFGFAMEPEGFEDVPQLGRVVVGDGVEIGANSTIDRGSGPDTVIGDGSKIDNLVQIGHNVQIGRSCVLVAQSGVAGSSRLEDFVAIAAQSGVGGHLHLGKGSNVAAASGVMRDVPAGQTVGGLPAIPLRDYFRLCAIWQRQLKAKGKRDE